MADDLWDRYHRAALFTTGGFDVLMLGRELLENCPDEALARADGFFHRQGVEVMRQPWAVLPAQPGGIGSGEAASSGDYQHDTEGPLDVISEEEPPVVRGNEDDVLYNVLKQLSENDSDAVETVINATSCFYDETYYRTTYASPTGPPYSREEPEWQRFFGGIASEIVNAVRPKTVLDAGCAIGMLVEALRNLGVDAYGIDISTWAIKQVPDDVRPYCSVGSILSPLPDHYDLITCIEVLEHLPPTMARMAISNLCSHSDAVLMSSTADEVTERTHLNVNPPDYWARLFAEEGFVRDFSYDARYISPDAVLYRRRQLSIPEVVADYEMLFRTASLDLARRSVELDELRASRDATEAQRQAACDEHDRLADRFTTLGNEHGHLIERHTELKLRRNAELQMARREIELLERSQSKLSGDLAEQTARAESTSAELTALHATKLLRYSRSLRRLYGWLRAGSRRHRDDSPRESSDATGDDSSGTYLDWIARYDRFDVSEREALLERLQVLSETPLISILLPVYNTPEPLLRRAIETVRGQIYPKWELCIADDMSTEPAVVGVLSEYELADERIRVVRRRENGHISASSNSALEIAKGDWVIPMDHDDELRPHALAHVVLALADHPDAGMVFSDEDKIDLEGTRHSPNFKPDFDPLLLLGQNYLGHLVCYRRDLAMGVGGYREGFEGSQDWDLSLRASEQISPEHILHIPRVLYHWRSHTDSTASGISAKPYAALAGRRAVEEHLTRVGAAGTVVTNPLTGWHRVLWQVPSPAPKVSIIVPTRDGQFLSRCLESLFRLTAYPNFEVVVLDNGSVGRLALDILRGSETLLKVIRDERPFNYSGLNNFAANRCEGELLCLLNDDCEVTTTDWLGEMVGQVAQPGVGAVGAKLLYPDGRIQHAGVILGFDGVAGHANRLQDRLAPGHGGRLHVAHSVGAVTGACMVTRRDVWNEVGGLDDQNLPIAFNDVDYCLRIREAGWQSVWTPFAEMLHHESLTRGSDTGARAEGFARECAYMKERWGSLLRSDPAYNPNLSLWSDGGEFAYPPRIDRT
jgi:GT2 family glycosyltransferase